MKEKYESLTLSVLRDLAKARGLKGVSSLKKGELVEAMLHQDEKDAAGTSTVHQDTEDCITAAPMPDNSADTQQRSRTAREEFAEKTEQSVRGVPAELSADTQQRSRPARTEASPENNRRAQASQADNPSAAGVRMPEEGQRDRQFRNTAGTGTNQRFDQRSDQRIVRRPSEQQGMRRTPSAERRQNTGASSGASTVQNQRNMYSTQGTQNTRNNPAQRNNSGSQTIQNPRIQGGIQNQQNQRGRLSDKEPAYVSEQPAGRRMDRPVSRSDIRMEQSPENTMSDYLSMETRQSDRVPERYPQPAETRQNGQLPEYYPQSAETPLRSQVSERYPQSPEIQQTGRTSDRYPQSAEVRQSDRVPERYPQSAEVRQSDRVPERYPQSAEVQQTGRTSDRYPQSAESQQTEGQQFSARATDRRSDRISDADRMPAELAQLDSGISVGGILEVLQDGYGFIRSDNYLPGENDVYVSPSQIRKFNLRTGDIITGNTRLRSQQEKFSALLYLKTINGLLPSEAMKRYNFEDMTPIFPNERLRMERGSNAVAMRIVDLFSPIGKGQRGMIVSPPKAGKTTLLKEVARSILENDPNMKLIILLIDERPEEVTDIKEAIHGANVEVIYSTFDELPEHHKRVSEMVIERAKRLVEQKADVTILLDSITRLARAYNLTVPPSGRTLSGGLDPAALHMPKRFFGAARNMREGGSLTILATALVDTGSKMDDVVYEEFKGTGNMELVLDRKLSEKRLFPAIDIPKSGTRREDLLLDQAEQEAIEIMRRGLNSLKADEAVESIINLFVRTRDNAELINRVRRQRYV